MMLLVNCAARQQLQPTMNYGEWRRQAAANELAGVLAGGPLWQVAQLGRALI